MNKVTLECINCTSQNLKKMDHKISESGQRVNDYWSHCNECGKESPMTIKEVELARELSKIK